MYKPNNVTLRLLRRAVKTQREAREALCDLRDELSPNQFSEQMEDLLKEEVADLELNTDRGVPITIETLEHLIRSLSQESP